MDTIDELLAEFHLHPNFAWTKINHGFWEALGWVQGELGWPVAEVDHVRADELATRQDFFTGGFVEEFLALFRDLPSPGLTVAMELSAWPNDNRIAGTPADPEIAAQLFDEYNAFATTAADGLLLKRSIHDGSFAKLLDELANHALVVVGPDAVAGLGAFVGAGDHTHVPIHPTRARKERFVTEAAIADAIESFGGNPVVLLQAGTLAPYWIMRMRDQHPNTRWIDGGLAFSIAAPDDIFSRQWGKVYRREIAAFHNSRNVNGPVLERDLYLRIAELERERLAATPVLEEARFVEDKAPDHARVRSLLDVSDRHRQWANGGPLVGMLEDAYAEYMHIPEGTELTAVANAGLGLEALARVFDHRLGRRIRWGVSAFTFKNQRRGYLAKARVIDCDRRGMLNTERLEANLEDGIVDGFIVTNIFGLWTDFDDYIALAEKYDVPMMIDNAAGIAPSIPDWPHQVFSLHHTKPYGVGEGGLMLAPSDNGEALRQLVTYGDLDVRRATWLNNAKLSEVAAAYHLDRLERAPEWLPLYEMQGLRVSRLAIRAGMTRLFPWESGSVAMSMPFLTEHPHRIHSDEHRGEETLQLPLGQYYIPLGRRRRAKDLYGRIVNIPTHPDVARLDEETLLGLFTDVAQRGSEQRA